MPSIARRKAETEKTNQEIEGKIKKAMADPAYTNKKHPQHATVLRKVESLFKSQTG